MCKSLYPEVAVGNYAERTAPLTPALPQPSQISFTPFHKLARPQLSDALAQALRSLLCVKGFLATGSSHHSLCSSGARGALTHAGAGSQEESLCGLLYFRNV